MIDDNIVSEVSENNVNVEESNITPDNGEQNNSNELQEVKEEPSLKEDKSSESLAAEKDKKEKVYLKSDVAKIAKAEAQKAYERGVREGQQKLSQSGQPQQTGETINNGISSEVIQQYQALRMQEKQQEVETNIATEFVKRLDFENDIEFKQKFETMGLNNLSMPYVYLLNSVDNTKDVVDDLINNPEKLSALESAGNRSAEAAKFYLEQISKSIKVNKEALKEKTPNKPLTQITPTISSTDSGDRTVEDFKKMFRGRF